MSKLITDYHTTSFDRDARRTAVANVAAKLRDFPDDVGLVCTGLSGILITVAVADETGREFAIVRKSQSHSFLEVEGYMFEKYVIIDDFIEEGNTVKRIMGKMSKRSNKAECLGIILYNRLKYTKSINFGVPVFAVGTKD